MRRAALALALLASPLAAQPSGGIGGLAANVFPVQATVAQLPAADGTQGMRIVTDGATSSDCSVGGGSEVVVCVDTGSWSVIAGGGGGGTSVALDLADDGANESSGLIEFATSAASAIFSEPAANKLLVDLSQPWPTATALAANGANCAAGSLAAGVDASGAAEGCADPILETELASLANLNTQLGTSIADGAHTTDTDTTCLDAGVACLFAGSASEGGAATTALALASDPAGCGAGNVVTDVAADGTLTCTADDTGTDDQAATEVAYTPTTGTDWVDPDPTEVGGALDDLAGRLTVEEAKPDDDVPESGDFGNAGSLEADGTLSTDAVDAITEIAAALKTGADTTLVTGTAGGTGICAEWNADGDLVAAASAAACGAGGSVPVREFVWSAAGLSPLEHAADSIAPLSKDAGTNADVLARVFDDGADECVGGVFTVPSDVDSSGTVTFAVVWYSASVTTGNVVWDVRHSGGQAEGASWDTALTTVAASADAVQGTVDLVTRTTWTETVTNLGWSASEVVSFESCRDADNVSDSMTGDAALLTFTIGVPRA